MLTNSTTVSIPKGYKIEIDLENNNDPCIYWVYENSRNTISNMTKYDKMKTMREMIDEAIKACNDHFDGIKKC